MHWLLAVLAFRSDRFGTLVKGRERTVIRNGVVQWDEMRGAAHISRDDLPGAFGINAKVTDPSSVAAARLVRSGDISVIPRTMSLRRRWWRCAWVRVEDGVQTVRVEVSGT